MNQRKSGPLDNLIDFLVQDIMSMTDDEILAEATPEELAQAQDLARRMEAQMTATIAGPPRKERQTALRLRGRRFETVKLDDNGKVIEPPPRCWRCGPVLLCSEHFVCT